MSENAAASAAVSSVVEGLLAREDEEERREESLQNTATRLAEDLAQVISQQQGDRHGRRGGKKRSSRSPLQLCRICWRVALLLAGALAHLASTDGEQLHLDSTSLPLLGAAHTALHLHPAAAAGFVYSSDFPVCHTSSTVPDGASIPTGGSSSLARRPWSSFTLAHRPAGGSLSDDYWRPGGGHFRAS